MGSAIRYKSIANGNGGSSGSAGNKESNGPFVERVSSERDPVVSMELSSVAWLLDGGKTKET